jgi:hypothetical protein
LNPECESRLSESTRGQRRSQSHSLDLRTRVRRRALQSTSNRFGRGRDWKQLLSNTEALLVNGHSPPYNTQHIIDYTGQALHVQNWGNRGRNRLSFHTRGRARRPELLDASDSPRMSSMDPW